MMNFFTNIIRLCQKPSLISQVRNYEKKFYTRRRGYEDKILMRGLLPRSKDAKPIVEIPVYRPKNSWSEKRALFGQNDYIDILGDGSLHPTRLLTKVPYWLRGFKGNEYTTAQRKMKYFAAHWAQTKPQKYQDLRKRVKYLHKWFNKYRPT